MPRTSATGRAFVSAGRRRARRNKLRGIGLATYIEVCGGAGPQLAVVRLERDGNAKVVIGSQSTGQGHQTAYAQLIAEHLDLPPERVTVVQGDTDSIVSGFGTGGSSSIPAGGASVSVAAKKLADNLKKLAADALEAGPKRPRNGRWSRARRRD